LKMMIAKNVNNREGRRKAAEIATRFFRFVVEKHSIHPLPPKALERLEVLPRMRLDSPSSPGRCPRFSRPVFLFCAAAKC
jgi:hypothetical protein